MARTPFVIRRGMPELLQGETLLIAAREGRIDALGQLFESVRGHLLLAARRTLPRRLQAHLGASDLVQDAVAAGHRQFHAFRGGSPAESFGWMRSILRTTVLDSVRRHNAACRRPMGREMDVANLGSHDDALADADEDRPDVLAIRAEDARAVTEAMQTLPTDQRRAMWLRHWEGMTFPEIGATMGRSDEAARKLWCRGFERVREALGGTDEDAPHRPDVP